MTRDSALLRIPAVLYRVTRPDRADDTSRDQLRTAARACGVTVVLEATDSAGPDRPGLRRVLEAATSRQVAVVLVPKLGELGDSTAELLASVHALRDASCRLVVTSQALDVPPESAVSDALVAVLAAVGELERERDAARLGSEGARRGPRKPGRPPSKNAPDSARVRELRAQHCSWGQIAQRLHCTREAARRAFARTS